MTMNTDLINKWLLGGAIPGDENLMVTFRHKIVMWKGTVYLLQDLNNHVLAQYHENFEHLGCQHINVKIHPHFMQKGIFSEYV